jgi:hypothetical protein
MHSKSYLMPASVEVTWRAYTNPDERKIWFGYPMNPLENALEVRSPNFLRFGADHPGLPGPTEVSVTFEALNGETQITQTHFGFGDGLVWENALHTSSEGVDEMMSDLALYLRTGVGVPRHVVFHCFDLLKGTREAPGGLEIFEATPGTLAAEIGLQPGDTIVGLGGAGVFGFREVQFFARTHAPGDVVEVKWVRGNQVLTAQGKMTGTMPLRQRSAPTPQTRS